MISLLESFISALAFLKQAPPSPDRDSPEAAQGIRNEFNRTGVIQSRSQVVSVLVAAIPPKSSRLLSP
jgi:hypothetical protein